MNLSLRWGQKRLHSIVVWVPRGLVKGTVAAFPPPAFAQRVRVKPGVSSSHHIFLLHSESCKGPLPPPQQPCSFRRCVNQDSDESLSITLRRTGRFRGGGKDWSEFSVENSGLVGVEHRQLARSACSPSRPHASNLIASSLR